MLELFVRTVSQNHFTNFTNFLVVLTFINFDTDFHIDQLFANCKLLLHFDPGLFKNFIQ